MDYSTAAMQLDSSLPEAEMAPISTTDTVPQAGGGSPTRFSAQPVNGLPSAAGQPDPVPVSAPPALRSIFSFNALTTPPAMPVLGLPAPLATGAKAGTAASIIDTPAFSPLPYPFSLVQPSPMLAGFDANASPVLTPRSGSAAAPALGRQSAPSSAGQLKGLMLPPPTATSATDWGRGMPGHATAKGLPGAQPPATVAGLPPAQYLETLINR